MFLSVAKSFAIESSVISRRFSSNGARPSLKALAKKALVYNEQDGYVMKSPYEPIAMPELTIDQYVWKNMPKWQNHIAIACGITGRKYTYAKLRDHSAALAIRLRKHLNLSSQDVVAISLPNVPEYPIALLGSIEAGLVVSTVNPWYTAEEISRQLISSQPKAVFCLIDNYDEVKKACVLAKQTDIKVIAIKNELEQSFTSDMINFTELMNLKGLNLSDSSQFNANVDLNQLTLLPYSSGTTGMPKGVMLTHNNITSNCEAMDYDPIEFLRICKDHKATYLHLVPPTVIQLANHPAAKAEHFQYVRKVMSAASTLAQADAERFGKIAPNSEFFQGYGLTETAPITTMTPEGLQNYATVGWTISNVEMKIASLDDASLKGLAPNETGELLVSGPNVMKGYFKNEEATNTMIVKGNKGKSWLKTGDIGHYDDNGLFYISDRLKELIKVNANQVAPAELEGILREHKDVLDAVVVGVSHPTCGEVPKAFVVRRPESKTSEKDLQAFVAKQVIKFKQLTGGIQFIESIPKTATGKILRREIRKIFS